MSSDCGDGPAYVPDGEQVETHTQAYLEPRRDAHGEQHGTGASPSSSSSAGTGSDSNPEGEAVDSDMGTATRASGRNASPAPDAKPKAKSDVIKGNAKQRRAEKKKQERAARQ